MTRTEDGDRALAERITAQVVPALASGIEVDERSESLGDRALTIWRHLEPHVHVRASARAAVQAVAAAPRDADARAALCFEVRKLLREQPSLAEEVSALFNDSSVPSAALVVSGAASVVITGDVTNSTILVGGDNTVQQFFGHHVSPKLARQDFTPELGRGEGLVGRRWIFDALERRSRASECGYFEILGAAGLGKTALAAAIAQRYGAAAFFASRFVRAADTCLNHLSAELIRSHGLPDRPLPIAVEQAATVFTHLLAEAAEGAKKKVWIVVDGLDEADPAGGVNPLRLPSRLPPGVFIVVTGRPGSPRLRIPRELRLGEYTLEWDSAEQQSDIEAYVRREATASDAIVSALGASSPPINVDAFVQRLLMQSHGNFAYLSFLLPDIADRAARHEPIELDALPDGLHEYYASEWERIEASGRLAGPQAWSLSYRPVIELLAVAEEPVTVAWLADHTGCPPGDIRTWAIRSWERFLICDRRREPETWRLAHQSFADFLAASTDQRDGDVSIPDAHRRVASYYLTDRLRRNAHGGYALRHLSSHLRAAAGGLPGEQGAAERARLFSLVDTLDWYQVQTRGDASGAMYLKDLENAWRAAEHANATEAKGPLTCLGREIRSAVFIASLRSRFQNIPPVLLGALVTYGQWNAVHALEVARQNPDPVGRAIASALVMDHLPASEHRTVADEVLSRARSISTDDWTRKIQYGFVPRIPQELAEELRRRGAVDRALVNANAVADVQLRSHLLACVIPLLVDPLQGDVVRQVLKQAAGIRKSKTRWEILIPLVGYLPQDIRNGLLAENLIERALAYARSNRGGVANSSVLASVLPLLPEQRRSTLLRECLANIGLIHDQHEQSQVLEALIREMADSAPAQQAFAAQLTLSWGYVTRFWLGPVVWSWPVWTWWMTMRWVQRVRSVAPAQSSDAASYDVLKRSLRQLSGVSRRELLGYLRRQSSSVSALGGSAAVFEVLTGISQAGRWWP